MVCDCQSPNSGSLITEFDCFFIDNCLVVLWSEFNNSNIVSEQTDAFQFHRILWIQASNAKINSGNECSSSPKPINKKSESAQCLHFHLRVAILTEYFKYFGTSPTNHPTAIAGGFKLHPTWYVPLSASASDMEIQRLLYQLGQWYRCWVVELGGDNCLLKWFAWSWNKALRIFHNIDNWRCWNMWY